MQTTLHGSTHGEKAGGAVLFVCAGNICRSPTAEAVFRQLVSAERFAASLAIDSAGMHGYHIGEAPDSRARQAAARRGYDLSGIRSRQVEKGDFSSFDLILAMDRSNLEMLRRLCPASQAGRLHLFMSYATQFSDDEVPDPYYGGAHGFDHVLDMIEDASRGLIAHLRDKFESTKDKPR